MSSSAVLIDALLTARRTGGSVRASDFVGLSRREAAIVQLGVAAALGGPLRGAKISVGANGAALVAMIPNDEILVSGSQIPMPKRKLAGLEVEVAVRLSREIISGAGVDVRHCFDSVFATIELIGTCLDDHTAAGDWGPFADSMLTGGLVVGDQALDADAIAPDGLPINVTLDGVSLLDSRARHPFGNALAPLQAFADHSYEGVQSLPAGSIVTTGSLTSLVPVTLPGRYSVRMGQFAPVTLTIVKRTEVAD